MANELAITGERFSLTPKNLTEALEYAKHIADSDICPKDFRGKPGNVLVAVQMGAELGIPPMSAIQNIAIINGRPSVWGDALLGIVQAHPSFVLCEERDASEAAVKGGECRLVRRGRDGTVTDITRRFTPQDAKTAGLLGKQGPWSQYPGRMYQMRARGFAIRDLFADVVKGLSMREEVQDYDHVATTPDGVEVMMPRAKSAPSRPAEAPAQQPDPTPPKPAPAPQPASAPTEAAYIVSACDERTSAKGNPFWSADLVGPTGETLRASCFSRTLGPILADLVGKTAIVTIGEKQSAGKTYYNVTAVAAAQTQANAADDDDVKF